MLLAIVLVAIGTYLARYLPLRFRFKIEEFELLSYSSIAIISALFVTSLVSFPIRFEDLGINIIALIAVAFTYKRWNNLGLSVMIGVIVHILLRLKS